MDQTDLLKLTIEKLERLQIPYAIVGSFASSIWGESRLTPDIDVVVQLPGANVAVLCDAFPDPEFYVSHAAAHETVANSGQYYVIHPSSGNKIDFMIARNTAWAHAQIERSIAVPLMPGVTAKVAAPDDVILGKLVCDQDGGSEKHLRDIKGMLKLSGEMIDRGCVERCATQLGVLNVWNMVSK